MRPIFVFNLMGVCSPVKLCNKNTWPGNSSGGGGGGKGSPLNLQQLAS